jgi:hypothetical protein
MGIASVLVVWVVKRRESASCAQWGLARQVQRVFLLQGAVSLCRLAVRIRARVDDAGDLPPGRANATAARCSGASSPFAVHRRGARRNGGQADRGVGARTQRRAARSAQAIRI